MMYQYDYRSCQNCVYFVPTPEGAVCNAFHLISGVDEDVSYSNQCQDFEADNSYNRFIHCESLVIEDLEHLDDIQVNAYNWNNANAIFSVEELAVKDNSMESPMELSLVIEKPDLIIRANKYCPIRCLDWGGEEKSLQLEETPSFTHYFGNIPRLRVGLESREEAWKITSIEEETSKSFFSFDLHSDPSKDYSTFPEVRFLVDGLRDRAGRN